ncbi:MAG: HD domain-containing protein [archaeon]
MKKGFLKFFHACEKLKDELRRSHTTKGRRESVADHSWRVALLALVLAPKKVDRERAIKLALVHDLCEVFAGDTYVFGGNRKAGRAARERKSMSRLAELLPDEKVRKEILSLWTEVEERKTLEGKFVKELDKLEVLIQYNEAPLRTWGVAEKRMHWGLAGRHAKTLGFLKEFAEEIDAETKVKLGRKARKLTESDYETYFASLAGKS